MTGTKTPSWPADKVERWPIDDLLPYAQNSRTHSDEQVQQLAVSMETFGWTMPILAAEDGTIIAGHGRVLAARVLGFSEVPVMVARGWSDAQRWAYTIADNKLAENAGWDLDALRVGRWMAGNVHQCHGREFLAEAMRSIAHGEGEKVKHQLVLVSASAFDETGQDAFAFPDASVTIATTRTATRCSRKRSALGPTRSFR